MKNSISPRSTSENHYKYKTTQILFLGIFIILIIVNIVKSYNKISNIEKIINKIGNVYFRVTRFEGIKGIKGILKNVEHIGYYTDKDLSKIENSRRLVQAQYLLAPTILHLNAKDYNFIIFDCKKKGYALAKMKEIKAIPIKIDLSSGVILARKIK